MHTLDHLTSSQSQSTALSKHNHDPTGWLSYTGDTQGASAVLFLGWMMVTSIPNQTAERFVWKCSYIESLQLFTSVKILKWFQLINTVFLSLWSDIMTLMDHMVTLYLYCTELSTCQLWLCSGDTQQVWVLGGPQRDSWWVVALLWTTHPTPNCSTTKFKERFPQLEPSFPTPIPKSVIKCWC